MNGDEIITDDFRQRLLLLYENAYATKRKFNAEIEKTKKHLSLLQNTVAAADKIISDFENNWNLYFTMEEYKEIAKIKYSIIYNKD